MNKSDCFVLDDVTTAYTWFGKDCSMFEQYKANHPAHKMADSRHGQTHAVQDIGDNNEDFWKLLGGKGLIKEALEVKDEKIQDEEQANVFKISKEDDKIKITDLEPKKAVLTQKQLLKLILGAIFYMG
eukprot:12260678-Ditylum_brightwellii.AAC.1